MEDLWAFNEEAVARAIAGSRIPVISCVGHEVDFTIADFVADLRAPTPSAAAELAVPVLSELSDSLESMKKRLSTALMNGQRVRRNDLERLRQSTSLLLPERIILKPRQDALDLLRQRTITAINRKNELASSRLCMASGLLRSLNPNSVVDRGYAIVSQGKRIIADVNRLDLKKEFNLRMVGGDVRARGIQIEVNEGDGQKEADV